jgi:dephospho-CoA kinase
MVYYSYMSLFYVTGVPGSGKSTVQKELHKLGFEAYDIDNPRFGCPVNKSTGESTTVPTIDLRTPEWFNNHEWRVSRKSIQELKNEATHNNIYLCGTATKEGLVLDLFDKVIYLNIDEQTLKQRLSSRTNNDFGKTEHELNLILERYKIAQQKLNSLDAIIIDSTQPIKNVVNNIIKATDL